MIPFLFFKSPSGPYYRKSSGGAIAIDDAKTKAEADLFPKDCDFFPPEVLTEVPTKQEFMRWIGKQGGSRSSALKSEAARKRQLAIWKQRRREKWVQKRRKQANEKAK